MQLSWSMKVMKLVKDVIWIEDEEEKYYQLLMK